ncbi:MAG TPA: hypothetical protein VKV33_12860 [Streptosporangiaceae bacterium]|nr:hypothetical protein [Streptosporangiaceae bacterium]
MPGFGGDRQGGALREHAAEIVGDLRELVRGALTRLGDSYQAIGDHRAAGDAWSQALAILRLLHDPAAGHVRARLSLLPGTGG